MENLKTQINRRASAASRHLRHDLRRLLPWTSALTLHLALIAAVWWLGSHIWLKPEVSLNQGEGQLVVTVFLKPTPAAPPKLKAAPPLPAEPLTAEKEIPKTVNAPLPALPNTLPSTATPRPAPLPRPTPQSLPALVPPDLSATLPPEPPAPESPQEQPETTEAPAPASASGAIAQPRQVHLPRPRYPALSQRRGEEGLVLLKLEVLPNGHVGEVLVLSDPGHPELLASAIEAAREAVFEPATRDGEPVVDYVELPIRFALRR